MLECVTVLVPDEALGTLELKAFLRGERAATQRSGTGAEWLWGTWHETRRAELWAAAPDPSLTLALTIGRELGLEARLAVGRDPLDAAIGGHALLKAALHQLRVLALLLHLR